MLLILSPSKTLDLATPHGVAECSQPQFLNDSVKLAAKLKKMSEAEIAALMEVSPKLAALNAARFGDFATPFTPANARPALFTFKGDVYAPMKVAEYTQKELAFAQGHVRILSGLYGLLRPLDLMQPYRLEMGRRLAVGKAKDLYGFWGGRIAEALGEEIARHKSKYLINLASEEYAKAVDRRVLGVPVIDVIFKEKQKDKLKIIGLFAKRARGLMADYIIRNQIDKPEYLKDFEAEGYRFAAKTSNIKHFLFVRG